MKALFKLAGSLLLAGGVYAVGYWVGRTHQGYVP